MINYEISSPLAGVVCREKQNADDDDREKVAIMIIRVDVLLIVSTSHALRREHTERDVGSRRRNYHDDVEGEICGWPALRCCYYGSYFGHAQWSMAGYGWWLGWAGSHHGRRLDTYLIIMHSRSSDFLPS